MEKGKYIKNHALFGKVNNENKEQKIINFGDFSEISIHIFGFSNESSSSV